jgi:ankyrin repeat protein
VFLLIEAGANLNATTETGVTALYVAAQSGHVNATKILINGGANLNLVRDNGATALYIACQKGHKEVTKQLIEAGCDVNFAKDVAEVGATALYAATTEGHSGLVELLIEAGANVNMARGNGASPIYMAAKYGHTSCLNLLLKAGGNANCTLDNGITAMYAACQTGSHECVDLLLEEGALADVRMKDNTTALWVACQRHHPDCLGVLIENNAELTVTRDDGLSATEVGKLSDAKAGDAAITVQLSTALALKNADGKNSANVKNSGDGPVQGRLGMDILRVIEKDNVAIVEQWLSDPSTHIEDTETGKGQTALIWSARHGSSKSMQQLMKGGANVNAMMTAGATALYLATQSNFKGCVKLLLSGGSNPNVGKVNGASAVYMAAHKGHEECLTMLIQAGANVNSMMNDSTTALQIAVKQGRTRIAEHLIKGGAMVNAQRKDGSTAVSFACQEGHKECLNALLNAGASTNIARRDTGATPLLISVHQARSDFAKLLIEDGADVNARTSDGSSAIFIACLKNFKECVLELIKANADLNLSKAGGATAMYICSQEGHADCLKMLIDAGAKMNLQLEDGTSPLYIATQQGNTGCMDVLIKQGADLHKSRSDGTTPLIGCVMQGAAKNTSYDKCIRMLVAVSPDLTVAMDDGATALHIAAKVGDQMASELLINNGADINAVTKMNETPIMFAALENHKAVVNLLVSKKCDANLIYCPADKTDPTAGFTALDFALENKYPKVVEMLRACQGFAPSKEPKTLFKQKVEVEGKIGEVSNFKARSFYLSSAAADKASEFTINYSSGEKVYKHLLRSGNDGMMYKIMTTNSLLPRSLTRGPTKKAIAAKIQKIAKKSNATDELDDGSEQSMLPNGVDEAENISAAADDDEAQIEAVEAESDAAAQSLNSAMKVYISQSNCEAILNLLSNGARLSQDMTKDAHRLLGNAEHITIEQKERQMETLTKKVEGSKANVEKAKGKLKDLQQQRRELLQLLDSREEVLQSAALSAVAMTDIHVRMSDSETKKKEGEALLLFHKEDEKRIGDQRNKIEEQVSKLKLQISHSQDSMLEAGVTLKSQAEVLRSMAESLDKLGDHLTKVVTKRRAVGASASNADDEVVAELPEETRMAISSCEVEEEELFEYLESVGIELDQKAQLTVKKSERGTAAGKIAFNTTRQKSAALQERDVQLRQKQRQLKEKQDRVAEAQTQLKLMCKSLEDCVADEEEQTKKDKHAKEQVAKMESAVEQDKDLAWATGKSEEELKLKVKDLEKDESSFGVVKSQLASAQQDLKRSVEGQTEIEELLASQSDGKAAPSIMDIMLQEGKRFFVQQKGLASLAKMAARVETAKLINNRPDDKRQLTMRNMFKDLLSSELDKLERLCSDTRLERVETALETVLKAQSNTYLPGVLPVLSQAVLADEIDVQEKGVHAVIMLLETGPESIMQALEEKDDDGEQPLLLKTLQRIQEGFPDEPELCASCKEAHNLVESGNTVLKTESLGDLIDCVDFMDPTTSILILGANRLMDNGETIIGNGKCHWAMLHHLVLICSRIRSHRGRNHANQAGATVITAPGENPEVCPPLSGNP